MTFLHASLLAGGLLALAPILLHMLGRRQPKSIVFPAIRFVRQTAIHAQRGWSIKRWLLLSMRVLLLLLLALALASPRVHGAMLATYLMIGLVSLLALLATAVALTAFGSGRRWQVTAMAAMIAVGLWGLSGTWLTLAIGNGQSAPLADASGPICAAVVIDTSPTMGYKFHNQSRLEVAKEFATWLMDRLPTGSQIAIVNSDTGVRLNQDRLSANRQLERTNVEGRAANLPARISATIDVLRRSELERREIYVLSDLSIPSWRDAESSDLATKFAKNDDGTGKQGNNVLLQIVDVSVPPAMVRDWSLTNFKLSQQTSSPGGQVTLSADVQSTPGSGTKQFTVELLTEEIDRRTMLTREDKGTAPANHVVDQQLVEVPDGGSVPVKLTFKDLSEGTNHAELRLSQPDPLEVNNVVYATIEARAQGQALVVCDDSKDGRIVSLTVDPYLGKKLPTETRTEPGDANGSVGLPAWEPTSRLGSVDLAKYSSMILYNPSKLDADVADRVARWVESGGGLLIILGPGFANADALMDSPIATLLPGQVKRLTRRAEDDRSIFLGPAISNHPMWSDFRRPIEDIPWTNFAVFLHWDIEQLNDHTQVLMRYTESEQPALIEEWRKQGRILTWTTPYPLPTAGNRRQPWNELNSAADPWPAYTLFTASVRHLAAWNKQQLNYLVDQTALLDNNVAQFPQSYELTTPQQERVRVEASDESLAYSFTRSPGQYRFRGLRPQGPVVRGFSVNVDRQDTLLERVDPKALDNAFGKDNYRIAREREEVKSSLGEGRYGRDLGPFVLVVIVMLLMAEQTMAGRFYAQTRKVGS